MGGSVVGQCSGTGQSRVIWDVNVARRGKQESLKRRAAVDPQSPISNLQSLVFNHGRARRLLICSCGHAMRQRDAHVFRGEAPQITLWPCFLTHASIFPRWHSLFLSLLLLLSLRHVVRDSSEDQHSPRPEEPRQTLAAIPSPCPKRLADKLRPESSSRLDHRLKPDRGRLGSFEAQD